MIVKRSISIRGHPTSISIEDAFWTELRTIAGRNGVPLAGLIASVDSERASSQNLSSAIRVFVLRQTLERAASVAVAAVPEDQNEGSSGGSTPGSP